MKQGIDEDMARGPSESPEAPGALKVMQAFINTRYGGGYRSHEELDSPERLRAWLVRWRLLTESEPVTEGDLRRAISAREALRTLLRANTPAPTPRRGHSATSVSESSAAAALDESRSRALQAAEVALNAIAQQATLTVRFREDGHAMLAPDIGGVDGALAQLLAAAPLAQADGSWSLLKICRNDACGGAFYDTSKNHSGVWCSMSGCGNRVNARISRARRRQDEQA